LTVYLHVNNFVSITTDWVYLLFLGLIWIHWCIGFNRVTRGLPTSCWHLLRIHLKTLP